jgi:hypothetical protein
MKQAMKKIIFIIFLSVSVSGMVFSQFAEMGDTGDGRKFLKRVENNLLNNAKIISNGKISRMYNLQSKTDTEKLLFGKINAMVEFFIEPSFEGAYGFRIVKDSLNADYMIEHKYISNWDTVSSELSKEFPGIGVEADTVSSLTQEDFRKMAAHNREMSDKRQKESLGRYKIDDQSLSVSNLFAEKLYETVTVAIKNFVMKGDPAGILDGNTVTFRCVVGDEVWTLTIHEPDNELLRLTDLCNQLIEDIKAHNVNEANYIALFEDMIASFDQYAADEKGIVLIPE